MIRRSSVGTEARIEQLRKLREEALHAGSRRAVDRQHEQGKLTARERIAALLDKGSFQ
jgi:propionyl-CoA carboxylase beta chain